MCALRSALLCEPIIAPTVRKLPPVQVLPAFMRLPLDAAALLLMGTAAHKPQLQRCS